MRRLFFMFVLAFPGMAFADQVMELAIALGEMVGTEEQCGLSLNQDALERLIRARVPADDLTFASTMANFARVIGRDYQKMSPSMQTAHCTQMRQIAASLGLKN